MAACNLIKSGKPIDEPAQMLLIKNDPNYNEQWPRALVPYKRVYGPSRNRSGSLHSLTTARHPRTCPRGTPFGPGRHVEPVQGARAIPMGPCRPASVTSTWAGERAKSRDGFDGLDPFNTSENGASLKLGQPGAETPAKYSNDDIHAIRILAMEPTTDRNRGPHSGRLFRKPRSRTACASWARSRCVNSANPSPPSPPPPKRRGGRKKLPPLRFGEGAGGRGLLNPPTRTGNPDTSFLAKIPADTVFTFQTLDKNGHGAEHGPDVASAAARRDPARLRRLPCPTARNRPSSRTRSRLGPSTRSST